jgi:hypothetical protein
VQDLSGLVHSIRCYGLPAAEQQLPCDTLTSLKQELSWLAQDIGSQLLQLAAEAEQLAAEVAADTKAAVAGAVEGDTDSISAACKEADLQEIGRQDTRGSRSRGASDSSSGNSSTTAAEESEANQEPGSPHSIVQQQQHPELQQLLAQHPLAPERLKQQVHEAYAGLLQQHQQQVQPLAAQQGSATGNSCGEC